VACLFDAATESGSTTQPEAQVRQRYERAVAAAREFSQIAREALATGPDGQQRQQIERFVGSAVLRAAAALTDPPLNDPKAALDLLANVEATVADQPDLVGQALQARIAALQALGRLQEAEQLMDRLLAVRSDNAGAVLAGLLQATADSARPRAAGTDARPAPEHVDRLVKLAARLAAWADEHRSQLSKADLLSLKLQTAQAYQQAGRFVSALELFNQCAELDKELSSPTSGPAAVATSAVLEGQAECLYQLGQYREAMSLYQGQLYRRAEWGSPLWWRAYLRSLQCHARLNAPPSSPAQRQSARQDLQQILQSIAANRQTHPDLGGPELLAQFNELEAQVKQLLTEMP
jgi:tetratricopeptide (TPR) repeat protein